MIQPPLYVTIQTNDNHEIIIPENVARKFPTIAAYLDDQTDQKEQKLHCPLPIKAKTFEALTQLLLVFHPKLTSTQPHKTYDLPIELLFKIIKAANFLDVKKMFMNKLLFLYASFLIDTPCKQIPDWFTQTPELYHVIRAHYFLITKKELYSAIAKDYSIQEGCSIQHALDYHIIFTKSIDTKKLILANSALEDISELKKFMQPEFIQEINLSHNALKVIPASTFTACKNLKILRLSHNMIRTLEPDCFTPVAESLELLDLSHNALYTLDKEVFIPFKKLFEINLEHNQISTITGSLVSPELFMIFLNDNSIAQLPKRFCRPNKNVTLLNLSKNRFTELNSVNFTSSFVPHENGQPVNVSKLDLSSNRIMHIEDNAFKDFLRIGCLDLSNNLITSYKILHNSDVTYKSEPDILELNLKDNPVAQPGLSWVNTFRPNRTGKVILD